MSDTEHDDKSLNDLLRKPKEPAPFPWPSAREAAPDPPPDGESPSEDDTGER